MTDNEAIKWQEMLKESYSIFPEANKSCDMAISAIKEVNQYKALGSIEEVKDLVSKGIAYNQVAWERDLAISQLNDIGLSLGEKTDNVKDAVEKQIAKKQSNIHDEGSHFRLSDSGYLYCTVTNKDIRYPLVSLTDFDYCPRCGQAINWSD